MATAVADAASLTGVATIDGLLQGGSWVFAGAKVLQYSVHINAVADGNGGYIAGDSGPWTAGLADALARAMAAWANVANLVFDPVPSGSFAFQSSADLAVTLSGDDLQTSGVRALAWFPDPDYADAELAIHGLTRTDYPHPEGDVYIDNFDAAFGKLFEGGQGFAILIHELGHALGLKHPGDDGGNARPTFTQLGIADLANANQSIMVSSLASVSGVDNYAATPMPLDILAIQHLYGANMAFHAGDDTYVQTLDGFKKTIWDAGGTDTIDASAVAGGVTIDLRPGSVMQLSQHTVLGIAYGAWLENAFAGNGRDTVFGNALANLIDGGAGTDTLIGGDGDDIYLVGSSEDSIVEDPGGGRDTVRSSASFTLTANVENLVLTVRGFNPAAATGNTGDNWLLGNLYGNNLAGLAGADTLDGDAGDDTLDGGQDNDILNGDSGDDMLNGANGADQVFGGAGNDRLYGGKLADLLDGGDGDDLLYGQLGNDTLLAGNGADTLDGGDGHDILAGGASGDTLFGNIGDDTLGGGKGGDRISGGDGADLINGNLGNDQVTGGAGADKFVFNSALSEVTNVDTIMDFEDEVDQIQLSATIFGAFSGQIGQNVSCNASTLLYNNVTGALAYDADGIGGNAAINFTIIGQVSHPATLSNVFTIIT